MPTARSSRSTMPSLSTRKSSTKFLAGFGNGRFPTGPILRKRKRVRSISTTGGAVSISRIRTGTSWKSSLALTAAAAGSHDAEVSLAAMETFPQLSQNLKWECSRNEPSPPVNFAGSRTCILVAIPLRLIVGFGVIQHGYAKLARGPEDFIGVLHAMGLPSSFLLGWLTIVVELVVGLMLLVGALIPLATLPMMIILFVAIITVHLPNGFSSIKLQSFDAAGAHFGQPGYETDLLYLASLLSLCFGGPGPFSVDGWLNRLSGNVDSPSLAAVGRWPMAHRSGSESNELDYRMA